MAVEFCYKAEGSDEKFDEPMAAVYEALAQSQIDNGAEKKVIRCVKYTGRDWECYTLKKVAMPKEATELGVVVAEDTASVMDPSLGNTDYMRF